jgi:hypothetical protein
MSVFETLQSAIHAVAREAVEGMTQAVMQGQPEIPFTVWDIREAVRHLPPEQEAICLQIGMRGVRPLLSAVLWEVFGLTFGQRHGGIVTVRGARQGTLGAELRQQLQEMRH